MAKLTKIIKINDRKLKEYAKPIQTPKTEPSARTVNNQGLLTIFEN